MPVTAAALEVPPDAAPVGTPGSGGDGVSPRTPRWQHVAALGWVVTLAATLLGPALWRGSMIGTYDLLGAKELLTRPGVVLHGSYFNTDPILQMIPWTTLNWQQVHHGMLPLWNPFSGLGLPLAFNWQSASFSIPSLLGYLVPLRYAYTTGIVATLVIAGSGAYVLARLLRLGFLGSVMVATVFELSGPVVVWLGYPQGEVLAWGGWLFAAGILVIRGRRRAASVTLLAVVLACAIYSGHPETLVATVGAFVIFAFSVLVLRNVAPRFGLTGGSIRRPAIDLVVGSVLGGALAAPLLGPALQITLASVRTTARSTTPPPLHDFTYFLFSSYDGSTVVGNYGFGGSFYYDETAAYVGVIAVVLAVVGIVCAVRRRRGDLLALVVALAVVLAVVFAQPFIGGIDPVPKIGQLNLLRALMPAALLIAVLAGVGADALTRRPVQRVVRLWYLGGFTVLAVVLARLWGIERTEGLPKIDTAFALHVRTLSFIWPVVSLAVGWALAGVLFLWPRSGRWVVVVLLAVETAFLVTAGYVQIGSSATGATPTPAVTALRAAVGDAIVAGGASGTYGWCNLGMPPESNIFFGIHQLNVYDPIVPSAYFEQWKRTSTNPVGSADFDLFCPQITTVGQARMFGVGFVLEQAGHPGPRGSTFVAHLAVPVIRKPVDGPFTQASSEDLYRIPGSSLATAVEPAHPGAEPPTDAPGAAVPVDQHDPTVWRLSTDFSGAPRPPPPPHGPARVERHDRRQAARAALVRRDHAGGHGPVRPPRHRGPLLARDLHRRPPADGRRRRVPRGVGGGGRAVGS